MARVLLTFLLLAISTSPLAAQELLWKKRALEGGISSMVISSDNSYAVTASEYGALLIFWDLINNTMIGDLELGDHVIDQWSRDGIRSLSLAGNGSRLAAATDSQIFIVDPSTQTIVKQLSTPLLHDILYCRLSWSGDSILCHTRTGVIAMLSVPDGEAFKVMNLPSEYQPKASASESLKKVGLVVGDTAYLIDMTTGSVLAIGSRYPNTPIVTDDYFLYHAWQEVIVRRDHATGAMDSLRSYDDIIHAQGETLWTARDTVLRLWSLTTKTIIDSVVRGWRNRLVVFSNDQRVILFGSNIAHAPVPIPLGATLEVYDRIGMSTHELTGHMGGYTSAKTAGDKFLISDEVGGVQEIDFNTGDLRHRALDGAPNGGAWSAQYTPEGEIAFIHATGETPEATRIIWIGSKQFIDHIPIGYASNDLRFEPGSRRFTLGTKFYHRDSLPNWVATSFPPSITSEFAPDAEYVWSAYNDTLVLQRPNGSRTYVKLNYRVRDLAVSNDGQYIATIPASATDFIVRLHNRNGDSVGAFVGHRGQLTSLNFGGSGDVLVTTALDSMIVIWNVGSRQPIDTLDALPLPYTYAEFSTSKHRLLAVHQGTTAVFNTEFLGTYDVARGSTATTPCIVRDQLSGDLRLQTALTESAVIEIIDLLGRRIQTIHADPGTRSVRPTNLPRGGFLVMLISRSGSCAGMFVN